MTISPNCVFFMDRRIRGIAAVGHEIFVIRYKQAHVSVYDSDTLREASRDIPIPGVETPRRLAGCCLAGCCYNKALYIIGNQGHILRVDLTDNSVTKWNGSKGVPVGLSVTAEHTLLATVVLKDARKSGVIEYTSTGERIRKIKFDSEIRFPSHIHVLRLPSDNFIVCHHGGNKYPHGRVCVVNLLGQVVNSYDGQERQDEALHLHKPCSIAMDDMSGRIFIADRGNHRILMLNSDLEYLGEVRTPSDVRSPSHLCFDSTHGRLFADSGDSLASYPRTVKTIQQTVTRCGLTVVDNEIFVIGDSQSHVSVYDSHSLAELRNIDIPDMKSPRGLAGCSCNKALYIINLSSFIRRVDVAKNFVTGWEMKQNYDKPEGLAVTARHTLLVTVRMCDASGGCGVVEYTSEGEQIREIGFDKNIDGAWHTMQLSSYKFIVCHGLILKNGVCKVDAEGKICESYGGTTEGGKGEQINPRSAAIDVNNKRIFVADAANSRVLILDTDLNYVGEVHTPPAFTIPCYVYYDSSTERLFVSDIGGRLLMIGPPD